MVLETGPLSHFWHWKNNILCCFLKFLIAQIPEKMKGLGIGLMLAFSSLIKLIISEWERHLSFTVCYDVPTVVLFVVLFVTIDILSKRYKLRERNREINIRAIAEEHYERYLDQEEEFLRENPQYRDTLNSEYFSDDNSCSD